MRLSLCIATYNEENNIHYPLESAYDLVDEVIIVDGGSNDKTVAVAQSYGKKVKVFIEKNPAMFHINKQKAIEKAKGEWILQLDADEALSKNLKDEISNFIENSKFEIRNSKLKAEFNAFYIPRKNWFLTRFLMKGGVYPDYTIRLYKNGKAKFPCKDVHENVKVEGETGYLTNPILHYADPTFERYLARWNRYTTLDAEELFKKTKLPITNYQLLSLFISYFVIKPKVWFIKTYFLHKGFMDGFPGFVFSIFSSIRFWSIYIKWWTKKSQSVRELEG